MQLFLGADPDTHSTGIAVVDQDGTPLGVWCIKARGKKGQDAVLAFFDKWHEFLLSEVPDSPLPKDITAAAVEGQEIAYSAKQGVNPRSLVTLAAVAGGLLTTARLLWPEAVLYFPQPAKWKGQVPKAIAHRRLYEKLGWEYEFFGKKTDKSPGDFAAPTNPPPMVGGEEINQGDWKHVADAVALARWARDQYTKAQKGQKEASHGAEQADEAGSGGAGVVEG